MAGTMGSILTGNYCLSSTFSHTGMPLSGQLWVRMGLGALLPLPEGLGLQPG
jgi:hypothetical protein